MSCMPLSIDSLIDVRETLYSSAGWRCNNYECPTFLYQVFCGDNKPTTASESGRRTQDFVERAFIFNSIEYFKGVQARNNAEPKEWKDALLAMRKTRRCRRMSIVQLYKTLQCIDYNTEPAGWLLPKEYENWARKDEYEEFKETIKRLINYLAGHIAMHTKAYEYATWG